MRVPVLNYILKCDLYSNGEVGYHMSNSRSRNRAGSSIEFPSHSNANIFGKALIITFMTLNKDKSLDIYQSISSFSLQHHLGLNFPAFFEVTSKHQTLVTELNLKALVHIHLQSFNCFMHKISIAPKAQIVTGSVPMHWGVCFGTA